MWTNLIEPGCMFLSAGKILAIIGAAVSKTAELWTLLCGFLLLHHLHGVHF